MRLSSPGTERRQVVRGHAYGHSARIFFDERRPGARVLLSRPHLSLSHGLKAVGVQPPDVRVDPNQPPSHLSHAPTPYAKRPWYMSRK